MKGKLISCLIVLLAIAYLGIAIPAASLTGVVYGEDIPTAPVVPWEGYPIDENYPVRKSYPVWEGYPIKESDPVWKSYPVWEAYRGDYVYPALKTCHIEESHTILNAYPVSEISPGEPAVLSTEYPIEPATRLGTPLPRPVKLLRLPQLFQFRELLQVMQ